MTVYVKIKRINGRHGLVVLAGELMPKGFDDRVEYSEGGWEDKHTGTVSPHLRFENEDDAIAYVLAYGGEVSRDVPVIQDVIRQSN